MLCSTIGAREMNHVQSFCPPVVFHHQQRICCTELGFSQSSWSQPLHLQTIAQRQKVQKKKSPYYKAWEPSGLDPICKLRILAGIEKCVCATLLCLGCTVCHSHALNCVAACFPLHNGGQEVLLKHFSPPTCLAEVPFVVLWASVFSDVFLPICTHSRARWLGGSDTATGQWSFSGCG